MSGSTMSNEEYQKGVSAVWRVTGILAVVTIVEVAGALIYPTGPDGWRREPLNLFFIVMSIAKAYYIIAVFMHMGHERRALQLTVLLPTLFLVWAIIAFLWEGSTWLDYRSWVP